MSQLKASPINGPHAELLACQFLMEQGLTLIEKNYRTRRGEIDLVMRDNETLVFVEVRYRKSCRFGTPQESITSGKRQRLTSAALSYIQNNGLDNLAVRFDAVAMSGESGGKPGRLQVEWLKNIID